MHQSKVFEAKTAKELENKLNDWLRSHPKLHIPPSTLHRDCPVLGEDTLTMVVFYEVDL